MGSRIRENVQHFFECFCEVVPPTDNKEAWIIQQYPYTYRDEEVLKSVSKFAYPYKFENSVIQHYSFVLTDIESKWTFGFCRHDPRSQTAIVVLSYLPWHQAFYKFLDNIAVLMHSRDTESLNEFLSAVYRAKLTGPGKKFVVPFNKGENVFSVDCPHPIAHQLPSIPENRNLTEYYNAVDANNMMIIFASMLYERRIIFTSKRLTRLSACVQSANDLLYPMIWQHIFIPVLPMAFSDYLLAPMPFLIGVPDEVLKNVNKCDVGEVVILDADNNTIETPFDDVHNLPSEVVASLKKQLKNRSALLGDGVSRAFLRALVQLIGGYRDALSFEDKANFDEEKFIETRPSSLQPFLKEMLQLQIFRQFIEDRLNILGAGLGFTDQFETEVSVYSEKSSSKLKQQYKEWTSTMKKEGTAFFRNVKDKANPAVKSAVKTVKDGGKGMKSAYKGLRSKLKDNQNPRQFENGLKSSLDKPRSAPNSPTNKRRPMTFRRETPMSLTGSVVERPYSPLSPMSQTLSPDSPDHSQTASPSLDIPKIDLMNEMKDILKLRLDTPPIDRSKDEETEDLIRLDSSSSDIDDFDPLKSNSANSLSNNTFLQNFHLPSSHNQVPMSVTNPLYNYENHLTSPNGTLPSGAITPRNPDRETVELLQEYGLDFQSFSRSKFDPFVSNRDNAGKVTSQNQWTKFE